MIIIVFIYSIPVSLVISLKNVGADGDTAQNSPQSPHSPANTCSASRRALEQRKQLVLELFEKESFFPHGTSFLFFYYFMKCLTLTLRANYITLIFYLYYCRLGTSSLSAEPQRCLSLQDYSQAQGTRTASEDHGQVVADASALTLNCCRL